MKTGLLSHYRNRKRELFSLLCLALISVGLLTIMLICVFNISPRITGLISVLNADKNFTSLRSEIEQATRHKRELEKVNSAGLSKLDKPKLVDEYYGELLNKAKSSGLEILNFEEIGGNTGTEFLSSDISLKFACDYQSLLSYIGYLESSIYPVSIRSMKINTTDAISVVLSCELSLTIFRGPNDR